MRRSRKPFSGYPPLRGFESLPLRHLGYLNSGFSVRPRGRWFASEGELGAACVPVARLFSETQGSRMATQGPKSPSRAWDGARASRGQVWRNSVWVPRGGPMRVHLWAAPLREASCIVLSLACASRGGGEFAWGVRGREPLASVMQTVLIVISVELEGRGGTYRIHCWRELPLRLRSSRDDELVSWPRSVRRSSP